MNIKNKPTKAKSKNPLKKEKEKTSKKEEKKAKEKKEKDPKSKAKKKIKKEKNEEEDSNKRGEDEGEGEVKQEEPRTTKEEEIINKVTNRIDSIFEDEQSLAIKLDSLLSSDSFKTYTTPELYSKINKSAFYQANLPLEKYQDQLSGVAGTIQRTIDGLEDSKCN